MKREEKEVVSDSQVMSEYIWYNKYYFPHCQLLLPYCEDDYFISAGRHYGDKKISGHATDDELEFRSAKKVFKQFVNQYSTKVQAGSIRKYRGRHTKEKDEDEDEDDHYEYYGYSDEDDVYGDYEEVVFPALPKTAKIEIPKKCQRHDVCYIMKLCIFCKPYFKKQLNNP